MIFDQILFHNVEELEETEKGYLLRRVCKKVRDGISDGVQNNRFATGVELRFRMTDGAVDLTLSSELVAESATVHIFFGSFQGGGEYSSKNVGPGNTTIHIEYPTGMEKLRYFHTFQATDSKTQKHLRLLHIQLLSCFLHTYL